MQEDIKQHGRFRYKLEVSNFTVLKLGVGQYLSSDASQQPSYAGDFSRCSEISYETIG